MTWKPDYITATQLADYMKIDDTDDNGELATVVSAASRAVDRCTHRQFGAVSAEARTYNRWRYDGERCLWWMEIDDTMSAPSVLTLGGTTLVDYSLEPLNAISEGRPYTRLYVSRSSSVLPYRYDDALVLTAPWGWTAVPASIIQATKLQGSRFHSRRNSPFGVAGSPEGGGELRLLARVDPDVAVALKDYVRTELPS